MQTLRLLEKELEGNSHASFSKRILSIRTTENISYPELSCNHQSSHWRQVSRCLRICCSLWWMRVQHSGRWDSGDSNEMLKSQKILFKDVHSMWLSQRPNGEKQCQDWAMNGSSIIHWDKRGPHIMSPSVSKNVYKNQWQYYLNLQKNFGCSYIFKKCLGP